MFLISLVTGLLPNVIYPYLTMVFDPNILGIAFVVQPLAALAIALILGLQELPGLVIVVGITLNILGNFMVRKEISAAGAETIALEDDLISIEKLSPSVPPGNVSKSKKHLELDLILV